MRALIKSNPKMEHVKGEGDQLAMETQLTALQEQLVAVMLDNQHLNDEVKRLREFGVIEQLRQELEREREKSRIMMEKIQEREAKEKEREKSEREARERERHPREKSLPPGDKSPSLPQRIRKRINQMHKSQSFEVEDGSPGPPPPLPSTTVTSEKCRQIAEERTTNQRAGQDQLPSQIVKYGGEETNPKSSPPFDVVESTSRSRFAWKRRGLEKSKSLDQSEFLASLSATVGVSVAPTTSKWVDEDRRESDSDDGEKGALIPESGGPGSDSDSAFSQTGGPSIVATSSDPWWKRLETRLVASIGELMRDFSEVAEEELPDGDPEGDPLTVKKLKENILRFGSVMRPLTDLSAVLTSLLRWESPSATLLALCVYLYCVVFGWLLTLLLILAIIKLSFNYLKKRGWTQHFFRRLRRECGEPVDATSGETGLGDKFVLVLQVARRVQNQLGAVSNAAEKCKNLLLWEHEATRHLYVMLWIVLMASILLPSAQIFSLAGVYLGIKFFIMDFVFFRYPRIRQKYDSTSRLWDTLPTDAELERRGERSRNENGNSSPDLTSFLELFSLSSTETPLPGWQSGRRCTLVNRDRSLTSAFKNGRLYLTNRLAKQDKGGSPSNKGLSNKTSTNKTTVSGSKGHLSVKLPPATASSSKQRPDLIKRSSLQSFGRNQSDASSTSATQSFSFLSKGSRSSRSKDSKDSTEEDDIDFLAKIFENVEDNENIDHSKLFPKCDVSNRSSPKFMGKSFSPELKYSVHTDFKEENHRPSDLVRRKGLLLRSTSETSHASSASSENDPKDSSPYSKRRPSERERPVRDADSPKKKTSKMDLLKSMGGSDDSKSKASVIDKLNEQVFYAM